MIFSKEISVSTEHKIELVDITEQVEVAVSDSKLSEGLCVVHAPHATAAIVTNENESGLLNDFVAKLREFFPETSRYMHNRIDDNAASHLASMFLGSSRLLPVFAGRIVRGTWQHIFLVELDGPRSLRRVVVQLVGS